MSSTDSTSTISREQVMNTHLAHQHDPDTSHHAAATLNRQERDSLKAAILDLLGEEPRTVTELTAAYMSLREANGWPFLADPHNIARRLSELHMMGRVYDTKVRRPSKLGKPSAVWAVRAAA